MNCVKKNKYFIIVIILLIAIISGIGYYSYKTEESYRNSLNNKYNEAFINLVNYMNKVESLLAKATISKNANYSAETLTDVWRDSNLALVYLGYIPMNSNELSKTAKFLNQVSDYSYSLSRKNIDDNELTEDDFNNLKELHQYSVQLEETLNQLSNEIYEGKIKWKDLEKFEKLDYIQSVDNISTFSTIDSNLNQYEGLIYDGAYSDHVNKKDKVGLGTEDISEEQAYQIVKEFFGEDNVDKINLNNFIEKADIPCYDFSVNLKELNDNINIEISEKGGKVVEMQHNRDVNEEKISQEEANEKGKKFLEEKGFENMQATYFTKNENIVTINYAYEYNNIIAYPDLIKVKVALDNGEILGIETEGYLNSHTNREFDEVNLSIDEAREKINDNIEIKSERMAIIPTEWKTEILCYEFKGDVDNREFIVYINCETGEEENILVILDTPGGTLTV